MRGGDDNIICGWMRSSRASRLITDPMGSCPVDPPAPLVEADSEAVRLELERLTSIDEAICGDSGAHRQKPVSGEESMMTMCYNNECFSEDVLRRVFDAMVLSSGSEVESINKMQFIALFRTLKLGLSAVEIGRVWNQLGVEENGSISFGQFAWAINRRRLFRRIVSAYLRQDHESADPSQVREDYDYTKPTCENYAEKGEFSPADRARAESTSKFAHQRAMADYSYHPLYTKDRRSWQDQVVRRVAVRSEEQSSPWLVYTCGAMGAGKGYVLHWLSEHAYFPLEDIVHIDPDGFKNMMPEFKGYVARDRDTAGSMTHRESGYLAEIAQEVAMERRQHVWIDGSLRDAKWYEPLFQKLRARHPVYRIAIFYIDASPNVAWRRTQARAAKTGRAVPKALFLRSINAPAESLRALTPYVDFLARLENERDGEPPRLVAFETVDSSGDLGQIRRMMLDSEPDTEFGHFPQRRGPLRLCRCFDVASSTVNELEHRCDAVGESPLATAVHLTQFNMALKFASQPHVLNWGNVVRRRADVPRNAVFFAIIEPTEDYLTANGAKAEPEDSLRAYGGLAYLDLQHTVLRVVAFCSDKSNDKMLRFQDPVHLPPAAGAALRHRWRSLPLHHLARDAGATSYCWISPCESLAGTRYAPHGGQAFFFGTDPPIPVSPSSSASSFSAHRRSASEDCCRTTILLYAFLGKYDD